MQCRIIRQLYSIEDEEHRIAVAIGPVTDDFILGLDSLIGNHSVVDVDNVV